MDINLIEDVIPQDDQEKQQHFQGQNDDINNAFLQQNIQFFNEQIFPQDLNFNETKPFQRLPFQINGSNVTGCLDNFLPRANSQQLPNIPHNNIPMHNMHKNNFDFDMNGMPLLGGQQQQQEILIQQQQLQFRGYSYPVGFPHHLSNPPPELPDLPLLNSFKRKFSNFETQANTIYQNGFVSRAGTISGPLLPVPQLCSDNNNNSNNIFSSSFDHNIDNKHDVQNLDNANLFVSKESSQSDEVVQQNKVEAVKEEDNAGHVVQVVQNVPNMEHVLNAKQVRNVGDADKSITSVKNIENNAESGKKRTSKYRGVTKHRRSGRWEAHIWVKSIGRQVYLGGYNNEEHAAEAYDVAAIKCKGPSVKTNFNISKYCELIKCMDKVTLDELVMAVRRQSQGFARGTSSFRGVTRHPNNSWESRIGIPGSKHIYLGLFSDEKLAAQAYDRALVRLRGTNAATNFSISNYRFELAEYHKMQQSVLTGQDVEQVLGTGAEFERWIKFGFQHLQCFDINSQCISIIPGVNQNFDVNQYSSVMLPQLGSSKKQKCETLEQVDESNGGNVESEVNVGNVSGGQLVAAVSIPVDFSDLGACFDKICDESNQVKNEHDLDATMFRIFNQSKEQDNAFNLEIEGQNV